MDDRELFTEIAKKCGAKENDGQGIRIIMPDGEVKPLTKELLPEIFLFLTGLSTGDEATPEYETWNNSFTNEACKRCSNNPKNGGSGVCQCILGTPKIT